MNCIGLSTIYSASHCSVTASDNTKLTATSKMPKRTANKVPSTKASFAARIEYLKAEIRELYLANDIPWIVGYSGGKDSTAVLQLTWLAVGELPIEQRRKSIHVISTDTLVENPVVAAWVARSLAVMKDEAATQKMCFIPHRLTPRVEDSFWVNLLGRGYPAPRHKFRWCTERLKIRPSTTFITNIVKECGEALLLLGSRKAESQARAKVMTRHEKHRGRNHLSPNASLPSTLIYTPIEDWTNDDVWIFLMQVKNPWGHDNKDLLSMYQGASPDGECPLVVDSSTPSCGDSRFGCWVCTMVEQDKSMTAMIQNGEEMNWMSPLLDFRNAIDFRWGQKQETHKTGRWMYDKLKVFDRPLIRPLKELLERLSGNSVQELNIENWEKYLRDFRRKSGAVQLFHDEPIHGPYIQEARECFLAILLSTQAEVRRLGPEYLNDFELITVEELQEIRRIWVVEKHELEDNLPRIYKETTGQSYPGKRLDDNLVLGQEEMEILRGICGSDQLHFEMIRELLGIERQQRANARRSGLFEQLEKAIRRHFYEDKEDAVATARRYHEARAKAEKGIKSDNLLEAAEAGLGVSEQSTLF